MKCVILAGGAGTRLREETEFIPKPMVLIGGKPILWHIMKTYSHYGINEFIICLGYKGDIIRDYFINYGRNNSDCTVDINNGHVAFSPINENWKVTLVDTGLDTQTGGRIKRIRKYVEGDGRFYVTYGDGLCNVDLDQLRFTHSAWNAGEGVYATLTAVQSTSRFGELEFKEGSEKYDNKGALITSFAEKSKLSWINGGYFIFDSEIFAYIWGDEDPLEGGLLSRLTTLNKLAVYPHRGFWQCMDTYKETLMLNDLWNSGQAPWKVWEY